MNVIAQAPTPSRPPSSGEILLRLKRLGTVGSVLYVAAHPDDENTNLLAYLANGRGVRATYLSMTRGDGGQNLIGSEQGSELGLIRTQELLAARRIDGAEQMFTRARDFGFSKTPEETLRFWGKDEALADVVWAIRRLRPDVVAVRFSSTATGDGMHGHHTASARLAEEAFRAAADPAYRPEQLKLVKPWQARRLVWNRSSWNAPRSEDLASFIKTDVGGYDPLLGLSYGEMAADSRSMHKSQGFGVARNRGPSVEYFKVLAGERASKDILEGVDTTWRRFPAATKLADLLARAVRELRPEAPEALIPLLLEVDAALDAVPDAGWRELKRAELHETIAACAGLWAEVTAAEAAAIPGGELKVTAAIQNRSAAALTLREVRMPGGVTVPGGKPLSRGEPFSAERTLAIPAGQALSNPYWLDERPSLGLFHVADQALVGLPENPPALQARFVITAGGRDITLLRPVIYRWTDPVAGERTRPLEIVPPVSVAPSSAVLMFPDAAGRPLRVVVKAAAAKAAGTLRLEVPAGWQAEPASAPFQLAAKGAEAELAFTVRPKAGDKAGKPADKTSDKAGDKAGANPAAGALRVVAEIDGARLSKTVTHIEHAHIPIQTLIADAEVRLVPVELKRQGARIGYIPGAGDEVPAALRQVGYDVTMLSEEALATGSLKGYDAIVVGVRAFNTNDRLRFHHDRLMRWVADGGTLVVQYNTNNRLSKVLADIGPYPFEITRDRVTEEDAAVTFTAPAHRLLNEPNKITARDFDGWVQERGLYFAGNWDPRYETVFAMNDAGEPSHKGSLLVARHGKGHFVYTGLSFFRQLPAGVPGAFRLFANLVAHGR